MHVVLVSAVHPMARAVLAIVGDGRSGDSLHLRDDKCDVYRARLRRWIRFRSSFGEES